MRARASIALIVAVAAIAACLPQTAFAAGDTVEVRLLETGQGVQAPDPAIADIIPVLQRMLRFPSYKLLGRGTCPRKEGASAKLSNGISVRLSSVSGQAMNVEVARKGQKVIQTKVLLIPGKPLVLGGIPGPAGAKLILVLTTR